MGGLGNPVLNPDDWRVSLELDPCFIEARVEAGSYLSFPQLHKAQPLGKLDCTSVKAWDEGLRCY